MSVIDADGHIIEPEGMFEHLPEEFHLRRPIPVRLPADTVRADFNGCWLIEGKSVPNIGSRGRTTASLSWTERSKKIDVSLGSQTLEDVESRLSDLDRFHIDCQIVFPTMFLASVGETVKLERSFFLVYITYVGQAFFIFFFFKQKTAYEIFTLLEFRRVLFRSRLRPDHHQIDLLLNGGADQPVEVVQ